MTFFWKKVKSISELNPPKGKAVFLKKRIFPLSKRKYNRKKQRIQNKNTGIKCNFVSKTAIFAVFHTYF